MPKGVTRRRPQTRARLLESALAAFAELGFHATSIEEICDRAGYTRGAFYSNFASKDELFFALFDENAEKVLERFERAATEIDPSATWQQQIATVLAAAGPGDRNWYLTSMEFSLHAIRDPRAAAILAEHDAKLRAALTGIVAGIFDRFGLALTIDPDLFARLVVAIREGGRAQSYVEPDRLGLGELERLFLPMVLEAVSTTD
ncbi:TetR/AcrR family transcriptional regulator [Pseudonocardia spinosispora]|uniref:TetR/AcrR family transcriptional regulator n=1 Tax=Pseudonocardia spinosispora TaxID=103441 RepID=UPI0004085F27|nr:TetR/AcrR family transcriptional regulator [Pseudonocardia spinosispora]